MYIYIYIYKGEMNALRQDGRPVPGLHTRDPCSTLLREKLPLLTEELTLWTRQLTVLAEQLTLFSFWTTHTCHGPEDAQGRRQEGHPVSSIYPFQHHLWPSEVFRGSLRVTCDPLTSDPFNTRADPPCTRGDPLNKWLYFLSKEVAHLTTHTVSERAWRCFCVIKGDGAPLAGPSPISVSGVHF